MIATVAVGLELYKEKMSEFARWIAEMQDRYGEIGFRDPMGYFSNYDWQELQSKSAHLRGMEAALGLAKSEINAIGVPLGLQAEEDLETAPA